MKMAHLKCPYCGWHFEDEAKTITCPHCGRRVDPVEAADTARADIW